MLFYKDINDLFHVGEDIIPASSCTLKVYEQDSIVALDSPDNYRNMGAIEVVKLQRENLSYYPDLATFLTENQEFFK